MLGRPNIAGANRAHHRPTKCRLFPTSSLRTILPVTPALQPGHPCNTACVKAHDVARHRAQPVRRLAPRALASGSYGEPSSSPQGLDDAPADPPLPQSPDYFWKSVLSRRMNLATAVEDAAKRILAAAPPGIQPDLAIVWVSSAFADKYEQLVPEIRKHVPSVKTVYGCTGFGVVGEAEAGGAAELESVPALSLTLAHLPGVTLSVAHVAMNELPDGDAPPAAWADLLRLPPTSPAFSEEGLTTTSLVVVADPSFMRLQELLVGLDYALPSAPVIGGLASAGALSPDRAMWAWTAEDAAAAEAEIKAAAAEAHAAAAAKAIAAATDATQRKAGRRSPDKEQDPLKAIQEAEERAENGEGMGSVGGSEEPELPTDEEVREKAARAQENGVRAARASGVWRTGACVLAIQGGVTMELVVAQGCRPLSSASWLVEAMSPESARVTALRHEATGQVVSPMDALTAELRRVCDNEAQLRDMLRNLTLGVASETLTPTGSSSSSSSGSSGGSSGAPEAQEFLIRAMGLDQSGAIAVGDSVRLGQRLRFMVRDERGAREDLAAHGTALKRRALTATLSGTPLPQPFATLMFSCNGRGTNLYSEPSYDARTVASYLPVPISGFLANGEIGKVGGTTHLHGFTCAVGVLRVAPPALEHEGSNHTESSPSA